MAIFINTNVLSLTAQNKLGQTQNNLSRAVTRLSTGLRINSAADDAAGLAISERLSAQIRGIGQAQRNANDGISALQTADGSLQEVTNLLQRARELSVQAASDSNNSSARKSLNDEVTTILAEIGRLANTAEFSGTKLIDGSYSNKQFQVGANANQTISFSIDSAKAEDLGAKAGTGTAISNTAFTDLTATSAITVNGTAITIGIQTTVGGVVAAVNALAGVTGVSAQQGNLTSVVATGFTAATTAVAAGSSSTLTINGVNITLNSANSSGLTEFMTHVNTFSNQTGVTVSGVATAFTFTNNSGGDIAIKEAATSTLSVVNDEVASSTATGLVRSFTAGVTFSTKVGGTLTVTSADAAEDLGLSAFTAADQRLNNVSILTAAGSNNAIETIDFALDQLSNIRSGIGAVQNRFSSTISSLQVASENLSAARSQIRDADVANETAELTRNQILLQAGVSVLAQANALPQIALSLLGG